MKCLASKIDHLFAGGIRILEPDGQRTGLFKEPVARVMVNLHRPEPAELRALDKAVGLAVDWARRRREPGGVSAPGLSETAFNRIAVFANIVMGWRDYRR